MIVLARSGRKFDSALEEWRRLPHLGIVKSENDIEETVPFIQCDLSDVYSVRDAVPEIEKYTDRVDYVFCNAGLGVMDKYAISPQGIEAVFAANVVGHQVLLTLLLPLMRRTIAEHGASDVRVIVTSSSMHRLCRELDLSLLQSSGATKPQLFDGIWRYARSKVGTILLAREFTERLLASPNEADHHIYVNAFNPGNIATEQMDVWKSYFGFIIGTLIKLFFAIFGQSTQDGASTALYLAVSPDVTRGKGMRGEYLMPVAVKDRTSNLAENRPLARELWDWVDTQVTNILGENWGSPDQRLIDGAGVEKKEKEASTA